MKEDILKEIILTAYRYHFNEAIEAAKIEALKKLDAEMEAILHSKALDFAKEVIHLMEKQ